MESERIARIALLALTRGMRPSQRARTIREMAATLIVAYARQRIPPPPFLAAIVAEPLVEPDPDDGEASAG